MHQHQYYHVRASCAMQALFTQGELAGRNFHYHFVVDRGMPYEVSLLLRLASMRPSIHGVEVWCQWWPSPALLTLTRTFY